MASLEEDLREHLGKQLRRVFRYSPLKKQAKALADKCYQCGAKSKLEIDHKDPVAPVDREIGALEYFKRMFCLDELGIVNIDNLIPLCKKCHKAKSGMEIKLRAKYRTGPYSTKARQKRANTRAKIKIRLGKKKRKKHVSARRKKTKR